MMSSGSSFGSSGDQFPVGLRVLVVDDDVTCLKILEHMLHRCRYRVTTCCQATVALSLLRERRGSFDVVISDVHMPDMNGFKLLELVGLEMDLPVIMMSADGGTNTVMRGIKHGACDYLIKPVRIEELKNIWQHVIRKKWNESRELEYSGSVEDSDRNKRVTDDTEYASSVNDGTDGSWKSHKKKRDAKEEEDDGDVDHDDPSSSKKPRVVWSVELHQQFVSAVSQLGIEKAVPKRILELMNVPGLTRENVASHLQKFRLYLKRISGVGPHQNGLSSSLCGPVEPNTKAGSVGRLDFQALAASGQIPPQTLAALHAELLGRPSGSLVLPAIDQPVLQASRQVPKCIPADREVAYGQPLFKCQSSISKQFPPTNVAVENASSGFSLWPSNPRLTTDSIRNLGGSNSAQNGNVMMPVVQQQQSYPTVSEPHHVINVQPSCLVVPSQSSNSVNVKQNSAPLNQNSIVVPSQSSKSLQSGNIPLPINPNSNCDGSALDYSLLSSLSNNGSLCVRPASDGHITNRRVLNGSPGSISSSVSSCSARTNSDTNWLLQHHNMNPATALPLKLPNVCSQEPEPNRGRSSDSGQVRNLGFVGKGTCIPSRFAVDDIESPTNDQSMRSTCIRDDGARVKQELHLDFADPSNFMGVLSK